MKKITQIVIAASTMFIIASCGSSKKEGTALINDKKAALEKLKSAKAKNEAEIAKLQAELEKVDSATANAAKIKLVGVASVTTQDFKHYIDLQGKVDAENISYISPPHGTSAGKSGVCFSGPVCKKRAVAFKA